MVASTRCSTLLAVTAVAAAQSASPTPWTTRGTTYDLTSMQTRTGDGEYILRDVRDTSTEYHFNFFSTVPSLSQYAAQCVSGTRSDNVFPSLAWQIEKARPYPPPARQDQCYRLGSVNGTQGWTWSFVDAIYPNRGVALTYPGGDGVWCPTGINRTLTVQVMCDVTQPAPQPVTGSATVNEINNCEYSVTMYSIAGCPLECLTGGSLCNGHGVCGFNTDLQKSQCYCYTNWAGDRCGIATKAAGLSVEGILLIIVCIVLAGVLGLIAFMFLKLRRLQIDPAAYDDLQGRFNELGQLA